MRHMHGPKTVSGSHPDATELRDLYSGLLTEERASGHCFRIGVDF